MKKSMMVFVLICWISGFVFPEKVAVFAGVTNPFYILADDSQLYITDGPTINIYSTADYKPVKRFGRAGEGPQEFKLDPRRSAGSVFIFIHPDYILASTLDKVLYFSKKGEFIKETRTNSSAIMFRTPGKGFAGEDFLLEKNNVRYSVRCIYDSNFKKVKELYRRVSFSQPQGDLNPFYMISPIMEVYQDRVYINDAEELTIHVFDSSGNQLPQIKYKYDKLAITNDYKNEMLNWYKTYPSFKDRYPLWKDRLKFPAYFPAIRAFNVADDKIYVLTHKKQGKNSEFIIFDIKGKFLKTLMVPMMEKDERLYYPYTIRNGKLYQLIENPDKEEWELHVTEIK